MKHPNSHNTGHDPDKVFDLGETRDEAFGFSEDEKDEIIFPSVRLPKGMLPGEVGSEWFVKMKVIKTGSNLNSDKDDVDIMNMRVLGSAGEDVTVVSAGSGFDDAVLEIQVKKSS